MVDDTYYITPHEAALAVVATSMKKSRLPFYILCINSIIGAFLFSAGGMLYVMCEAGGQALIPGSYIFVYLTQGAVYALGLFYVIVCGMELFNSNILFFSVGVMRGAVTLMDLLISWFVSFWVNLAATIFVVYVFCYCSGIFKQENYVIATIAIGHSKNSYSFAETLLKGIAGNFFVCLAVYLQIMVKPLHVKFLMIFFPIFTFVAMGFTHSVADMFMVPAAIFTGCGYGFGHYFWKIMLPGSIGNMIGGSFFGIVIPWYLHLHIIEKDMKKLKLPAYEERDEQPMLNMESRVVRVPTAAPSLSESQKSSSDLTVKEFVPDDENDISRTNTVNSTALNPHVTRVSTAASIRSRNSRHSSKQIRSPKGVFPVVDMGQPLMRERTIASAYMPESDADTPANKLDSLVDGNNSSRDSESSRSSEASSNENNEYLNEDNNISIYTGDNSDNNIDDEVDGDYVSNPYDPEKEKVSSKLLRAISRTVTRDTPNDIEKGNDNHDEGFNLAKILTHQADKLGQDVESKIIHPPPVLIKKDTERPSTSSSASISSSAPNQAKKSANKLFRQFTFGGGGNDNKEIQRRLSNAKISKKAAAMSNDIAGIHENTVDSRAHSKSKRSDSISQSSRKQSDSASSVKKLSAPIMKDSRLGGPYSNDRWKHFTYDYELDGEQPVSFISENSNEENHEENNK